MNHVLSWYIMVIFNSQLRKILNSQLEEAGDEDVGGNEGGNAEYDEAAFLTWGEEGSARSLSLFVCPDVKAYANQIENRG